MKKNFFKKLSFVLALAMLISCIAPAAGVFAATSPALNATTKYLHLSGITGPSEYDFNVSNKQTGWKYAWSSANKSVAVVDAANGVTTAVGVGSTKVTVKITKDGKTVKSLSATVVVRDNIETVAIANAPDKDLAVGATYDFNRTFVTESGSTVKTSSVTRWTVDSDKATIDNSGVFKATEAGTYKVTALAFQSTAKYEAWLTSKDASLVLDSKDVTVNVVASIVAVKQTTLSKFTVEFDSDMSKTDIATKAVVYQVINGKQVVTGAEKIKKVTVDGKVVTVEMYTNFTSKTDYNFVYGKLVGAFTAATTNVSDVAGITFDDFTTNVTTGAGQDMEAKVSAVNKDGVVILSGTQLSSYLTFTYGGDLTKGYVAGKMAYIYTEGYAATVTAKFETYVYNETTKTYDKVSFTDTATATGAKPDTSLNATTMQYAVSTTGAPASDSTTWGASVSVAAKETTVIYTRFKNNDPTATSGLSNYVTTAGRFSYTSSNTDLLLISGDSMYAIAPGTATIIVKDTTNNNKVVGTFDVVILAARSYASATIDTGSVTVGNNATVGEKATAKIVTKDTMGAAFNPVVTTKTIVNNPTGADTSKLVFNYVANTDKSLTVEVTARGAMAGAYNVKLTVGGFGTDTKDVYLTVIVVEANTAATTGVAAWKVEITNSSIDLKDVKDAVAVGIDVYGYNSANVRVAKLAASDYTVTVKKGDTTVSTNNTTFDVVTKAGTVLTAIDNATYVITASVSGSAIPGRVSGSYIGATSLVVLDTTTKNVTVDTTVVSGAALDLAVKEAFTFSYNGTSAETMTNAALTKVTYSKGGTALTSAATTIASGESVYVAEVEWTVTTSTGNTVVYKFTVDKTIIGK